MDISISFARLLNELINGEELTRGSFKGGNGKLLEKFMSDGVLDYKPVGTQRKIIYCTNILNLNTYLHHKFEIPSLKIYIDFLQKEETERSEAVIAASDSKIRNVKVFEGFLINTYENMKGVLRGEEIDLRPSQGSFIFISDYKDFIVPTDVTIIGVEGYENFKYINRQKYLFEGMKPLFVWRYQNSSSIANWLNLISNSYLHFGDFDPKGIHIYISEFRNKISPERCGFLVPSGIEELIFKHGEKKLYETQMEYLKNFNFDQYPEIVSLMRILRKLKKGLAQEVLIL